MRGAEPAMSAERARRILGVGPGAGGADLRRAFREAAKRAHPDRAGGDAGRFREAVAAFHLLKAESERPMARPPVPARPRETVDRLTVPPLVALQGGEFEHEAADGRRLRVRLPAGVRAGDLVRVGGAELTVAIAADPDLLVRGDDLWLTREAPPAVLAAGGRLTLETPAGRKAVWITAEAAARGLVRLPGQGLPARGRHRQGHMFVRLTAARAEPATSAARTLLERFAAAWAA